jgi:pSer/pThr/pTyr-binding forkhead associated (FHA) protein
VLYLFLAAVVRVVWRDLAGAVPARRGLMGRAFLVVVEGSRRQLRPGDRIAVEGAASIGRDSDNQVVVDETTVSGRHAAIVYREGRWWIEDLGSKNGTWVNDRQVQRPQPLNPGDVLQVGRVSFRLTA